jgi:cytochrome c biogenesis protein CcdA
MELLQSIMEWSKNALDQTGFGPATLPLAFLLGILSAFASACCTLPILGAIVGYSGTRKENKRGTLLISALFFMLGTIIALMVLGSVAGFIGQAAQSSMGKYWKIFAGIIAILAGIATLDLLPVKLPQIKTGWISPHSSGHLGTALFGLVVGGGIGVCSLPCNPGIFIILGVAVLQGYTFWAMAIIAAYAVGFSLPLTAIVIGVSFGKAMVKVQSAEKIIRITGGIILIVAGFYFLSSF